MNNLKENVQNQNQPKTPIIVKRSWTKPVSVIGVTLILVFGAVYIYKYTMELPGRAVDKVGSAGEFVMREMKEIAKAFNTGTITTEFRSYYAEVNATNYLQVANFKTNETFSKIDSKKILWDKIDLPDIKVEIKAPVEYTFYVDLNEDWEFILNDLGDKISMEVTVLAPEIKANTPSVNISELTIHRENSILRFDETEVEDQLRKEIMAAATTRVNYKIELIRAIAREQVEKFVQNWFINVRFKDNRILPHVNVVYFADEEYPKARIDEKLENSKKG